MTEEKKIRLRHYMRHPSYHELPILLQRKDKFIDYIHDYPNTPKANVRYMFLKSVGITDEEINRRKGYKSRLYEKNLNKVINEEDYLIHILKPPVPSSKSSFLANIDFNSGSDTSEDEEDEEEEEFNGKINFAKVLGPKEENSLTLEEELFVNEHISEVVTDEEFPLLSDVFVPDDDVLEKIFKEREEKCSICDFCSTPYEIQGKIQYNSITSNDIEKNYKIVKNTTPDSARNVAYLIASYSTVCSPHVAKDSSDLIQYEDICIFFNQSIRWFDTGDRKEVYFLTATPPLQYFDSQLKYEKVIFFRGDIYPTFTFSNGVTFAYDMGDIYLLPFMTTDYVLRYDNTWHLLDYKTINGTTILLQAGGLSYLLADNASPYSLKNESYFKGKSITRNQLLNLICSYVSDGSFDFINFFTDYSNYNNRNDNCLRILLNKCGIYFCDNKYKLYNFIFSFEVCTRAGFKNGVCDCEIKYFTGPASASNKRFKIT